MKTYKKPRLRIRKPWLQDFTVTCSCGAEAEILFIAKVRDFTCLVPGWQFVWHWPSKKERRLDPAIPPRDIRGWSCGRPGHYQQPEQSIDDKSMWADYRRQL